MSCAQRLLVSAALIARLAFGEPAVEGSGLEGNGSQQARGASRLRGSVQPGNASQAPTAHDLTPLESSMESSMNATDESLDAEFATTLDVSAMVAAAGGDWRVGGDKMWGAGSGIEAVNGGNVGYYDSGMDAARAHCGGAGCALIVNPPCCRSVNRFHIHFVHFRSYGQDLKAKAETLTCHAPGVWQSGSLPCGGSAAFFSGWPGVFSKALSQSISSASVIAWPMSCGGRGTIIEVAHGCSIEHRIRGDYNPNHR